MALIQDGGGGRGRTTPWPAAEEVYKYKTPWSPYTAAARAPTPSKPVGLTPQQVYPYATPWSPYSWNPSAPAGAGGGMTITIGQPATGGGQAAQQPQYANWWEQPGAMQPSAPAAAPQATPTAWWDIFKPFFEGAGAPSDLLKMRPQDWAAIPQEVRGELERWLRQLGWRPGGTWGRYGATEWGRAEGAQPWAQQGGYLGENVFAGISETLKPWIWWLSSQKGWAQPGREKPATTGWGW